jgi:hypothetical protein
MATFQPPPGGRLDALYGRREFEREWAETVRLMSPPREDLADDAATEPVPEPAAPVDEAQSRRMALLTPAQQAAWQAEQAHAQALGRDLTEESFVRAFLTNPDAHTGNMGATGLGVDFDLAPISMQAIREQLFLRDADGQERQDVARHLRATVGAFEDSIRLLATSGPVAERSVPLAADHAGFDVNTVLGRAVDVFGEGRQPDPALTSSGLYRAIAYRMELGAAAERQARAEGLQGAALDARVGALEADPTPAMIAETGTGTTLRTLNTDLSPAGPRLLRWAAEIPGGRLMLPFLATRPVEPTWFGPAAPTLNEVALQDRRDREAGDESTTRASARKAIGQSVAATIAWHVAEGSITGSQDQGEVDGTRVRSAPPYSLRLPGGRYVPYPHDEGTVGSLVRTLADYAELSSRIPATEDAYAQWTSVAAPLIVATGRTLAEPQALAGIATLLGAVRDGAHHASPQAPISPATLARGLGGQSTQEIVRAAAKEAKALYHLAEDTLVSALRGVPVHRDPITGDPVFVPAGWGGPVLGSLVAFWSQATETDTVRREIYENRVTPPRVPDVIGPNPRYGEEEEEPPEPVRLTHQERDLWITGATQGHTNDQGRTLYQELQYLMRADSPYWQQSSGPTGGRAVLIKEQLRAFYEAGRLRLLDPETGSPDLARDLTAAEERQARDRLARTDPRSPQYGMPTRPEAPGRRSPAREAAGQIIQEVVPEPIRRGVGRYMPRLGR